MSGKLIAKIKTTTSGSQTFTFDSIPQNYSHLEVVFHGLFNTYNSYTLATMRFNNDTSSSHFYSQVSSYGTNSGNFATGATGTSFVLGYFGGLGGTSKLWIPNYSETTRHKTSICTGGGLDANTYANFGIILGNTYLKTDAITRIDIFADAQTGSCAWIFGWK